MTSWVPTISSTINFSSMPTVSNAIFSQYSTRVIASFTLQGTLLSTSGDDVFEFDVTLPVSRTSGNFNSIRQACGGIIISTPIVFTDLPTQDVTSNSGGQTVNYSKAYSSTSNTSVTMNCSFMYTLSNTIA